jgi:hypothetical protein
VSLAGLGVVCRCQAVPFHDSASVTVSPEVAVSLPTAVHTSADAQDTDWICPPGTVTFGEDSMVHLALAAVAELAVVPALAPVAALAAVAALATVAAPADATAMDAVSADAVSAANR